MSKHSNEKFKNMIMKKNINSLKSGFVKTGQVLPAANISIFTMVYTKYLKKGQRSLLIKTDGFSGYDLYTISFVGKNDPTDKNRG